MSICEYSIHSSASKKIDWRGAQYLCLALKHGPKLVPHLGRAAVGGVGLMPCGVAGSVDVAGHGAGAQTCAAIPECN